MNLHDSMKRLLSSRCRPEWTPKISNAVDAGPKASKMPTAVRKPTKSDKPNVQSERCKLHRAFSMVPVALIDRKVLSFLQLSLALGLLLLPTSASVNNVVVIKPHRYFLLNRSPQVKTVAMKSWSQNL